ncbi:MAG: 4-hydroxy-tetrahydrodipicolinate reductase [Acidobacteria bacterium]|nr:4-hydroxy-tetrahydrodipicolinate reductase [Acidobacteriota bacterium]
MKVILIGRGRMGRLVESLCPEYGFEIAGVLGRAAAERPDDAWPAADVALDFTGADAVLPNMRQCAARRMNVVVGTTGWQALEAEARDLVARAGIGVVVAPNFAVGVHVFAALAEHAGRMMQPRPDFSAWIHELHHAAKRDAPSGTAVHLEGALRRGGFDRGIDIASTRAGFIPGTHTIGFDAAGETITLTHSARDRSPFARGALEAARWVQGRSGWFSMADVLGG